MANVFVNYSGIVEQPIERGYDPQKGYQTTRRWKGNQADIEAQELVCRVAGYVTAVTGGPVWELKATIATATTTGGDPEVEVPVDTWELLPNVVEKDFLEADSPVTQLLSDAEIGFLRKMLQGKTTDIYASLAQDSDYPTTIFNPNEFLQTQKLIIAGFKSKTIYQPLLRLTSTFSSNYIVGYAFTNIGKIYGTADLISAEQPPTNISYIMAKTCPSGTLTRSGDAPLLSLYAGWLKTYPTMSISTDNRFSLQQEWQYGEWSTYFYQLA